MRTLIHLLKFLRRRLGVLSAIAGSFAGITLIIEPSAYFFAHAAVLALPAAAFGRLADMAYPLLPSASSARPPGLILGATAVALSGAILALLVALAFFSMDAEPPDSVVSVSALVWACLFLPCSLVATSFLARRLLALPPPTLPAFGTLRSSAVRFVSGNRYALSQILVATLACLVAPLFSSSDPIHFILFAFWAAYAVFSAIAVSALRSDSLSASAPFCLVDIAVIALWADGDFSRFGASTFDALRWRDGTFLLLTAAPPALLFIAAAAGRLFPAASSAAFSTLSSWRAEIQTGETDSELRRALVERDAIVESVADAPVAPSTPPRL